MCYCIRTCHTVLGVLRMPYVHETPASTVLLITRTGAAVTAQWPLSSSTITTTVPGYAHSDLDIRVCVILNPCPPSLSANSYHIADILSYSYRSSKLNPSTSLSRISCVSRVSPDALVLTEDLRGSEPRRRTEAAPELSRLRC